jgi:ribose transport system ATP-binding protein
MPELPDLPEPTTDQPVLDMRTIDKRFGATHALRGVDFTVRAGEIHGLAGANGAGKSTLMKIINGVHSPDEGEMLLNGEPVAFKSPRQAQQAGIGMVFQEFSLVPSLTVSQNVFLASPLAHAGTLSVAEERKQTKQLMQRLGVDIDPEATVGELPVPHQQLTEIAKALAGNRRVLVLDEPTASLTQRDAAHLMVVLRRLAAEGLAIVFISHHLNELLELCDTVTVMRDGKVASHGRAEDYDLDRLVAAMLGGTAVARTQPPDAAPPASPALASVIDLHHGSKLNGVSFDIHRGDVIGIAGLLGSGRTELLECLAGLRRPSAGKIVAGSRGGGQARPKTALVPEDRRTQGLVQQYSIRENIALPVLRRISRGPFVRNGPAKELANKMIAGLSIKASGIDAVVGGLSGGNQQKVVIAKSLAQEAEILLLDDPTFGIDIRTAAEIMQLAQRFAAGGGAVLWVSSDFDELVQVSNRVLVLRDGRVDQNLPNPADQPLTEEEVLVAVQ